MSLMRDNLKRSGVWRDDSEIGLTCSHTASSNSIVEDIDAPDVLLYECIIEYADDVIEDLKKKETIQHSTLRSLPPAIEQDRQKLLIWMLEIRRRMSLRVDTYALAVGILDRYTCATLNKLNESDVDNSPNRTLGISDDTLITVEHAAGALMLAATLEETFPPETQDMVWFCKDTEKKQDEKRLFYCCDNTQLRTTSWKMASSLNFDLWTATWLHFLRRFSKASRSTKAQHDRAKAMCSVMTDNYSDYVLAHKPSLLAAAAVMKTRQTTLPNQKGWNSTLAYYTGYKKAQVELVANKLDY